MYRIIVVTPMVISALLNVPGVKVISNQLFDFDVNMGKENFIYIINYIYNLLFICFAPYFNKTDY